MAYVDPFDATTPTGANLFAQGDDRIRELKRALKERLATVLDGVDTDTDPWTFKNASSHLEIGLVADLPEEPEDSELFYFASDTKVLYVNVEGTFVPTSPEAEEGVTTLFLKLGLINTVTIGGDTDYHYLPWDVALDDPAGIWDDTDPTKITIPENFAGPRRIEIIQKVTLDVAPGTALAAMRLIRIRGGDTVMVDAHYLRDNDADGDETYYQHSFDMAQAGDIYKLAPAITSFDVAGRIAADEAIAEPGWLYLTTLVLRTV